MRGSTAEPEPEHHNYNQCEPVPGDRILQVLVAQVDLERPGARQPALGLRALQFDEKRRDLAPTLGSSNRNWVAHKPKIATGIILRRKDASGFRPPHHADQVGVAGGRPGGPRRRILSSLRHEASIDDDDPAGRDLSWREYPIAGSGHIAAQGRAAGVDERFRTRHERCREFDATELIACRSETRPALTRRQIARGCGKALFEAFDERFLPGLALKLPATEPDESYDRHQRDHGRHGKARSQRPCQRDGHGASPPVKRPSAALW